MTYKPNLYCCEWDYFYSYNSDGKCYRTSDDAGKGAEYSSSSGATNGGSWLPGGHQRLLASPC